MSQPFPPNDPPNGAPNSPPFAPIAGIELLIVLGVWLGFNKINDLRKKR